MDYESITVLNLIIGLIFIVIGYILFIEYKAPEFGVLIGIGLIVSLVGIIRNIMLNRSYRLR